MTDRAPRVTAQEEIKALERGGAPEALINSNGHLEVFLKEGRAADQLRVKVGDPIQVS